MTLYAYSTHSFHLAFWLSPCQYSLCWSHPRSSACIRMMSRDVDRDMRFSHMTDDKSWLSECDVFWRLEVAHVIKKIERDHDAWYAPRQHNLVRRRPIDVEAQECVVGVPAKRRMLSQLSEDVPAPPPPPYLFGGDGDVPVPF